MKKSFFYSLQVKLSWYDPQYEVKQPIFFYIIEIGGE